MGVVLYVVATRTRHVLVLPATMAFIVACFYVVLLATGTSLDDARYNKWLPEPGPSVSSALASMGCAWWVCFFALDRPRADRLWRFADAGVITHMPMRFYASRCTID